MIKVWKWVDAAAHVLHAPMSLGRDVDYKHWHHHIHLIPRSWMEWACDRYDLGLDRSRDRVGLQQQQGKS